MIRICRFKMLISCAFNSDANTISMHWDLSYILDIDRDSLRDNSLWFILIWCVSHVIFRFDSVYKSPCRYCHMLIHSEVEKAFYHLPYNSKVQKRTFFLNEIFPIGWNPFNSNFILKISKYNFRLISYV